MPHPSENLVIKQDSHRKISLLALNILQKAKTAQIPSDYLRIKKEQFSKILDEDYYKPEEISNISSLVYDNKDRLMKIPYIVIDGGDINGRKAAGSAILFRMIFYQYECKFINFADLLNTYQVFSPTDGKSGTEKTREELMEDIQSYSGLFISEFSPSLVKEWSVAGSYFDTILDRRVNEVRPTIVSFTQSLSKNTALTHVVCGQHFKKISESYNLKSYLTSEFLRIRVKVLQNNNKEVA